MMQSVPDRVYGIRYSYQHKAVILDSYWKYHGEKCYGEADEV